MRGQEIYERHAQAHAAFEEAGKVILARGDGLWAMAELGSVADVREALTDLRDARARFEQAYAFLLEERRLFAAWEAQMAEAEAEYAAGVINAADELEDQLGKGGTP